MKSEKQKGKMEKVLVTDCWTRKALAIVRALGKEHLEVHCISHSILSPPIYSKYCSKSYKFPLPQEEPDKYREMLIALIEKEHFECIITLEEPTIEIVYKAKEVIEKFTKISLPCKESYDIANDKWETIELVRRLEIPVPVSVNSQQSTVNSQQLLFPVVLKPRRSSGSRGLRKVNNIDEFNKYYNEIETKYGTPIIQECLPAEGEGLGVACLAEDGITKVSFSYKRLREYPVSGGPGTLNESTDDSVIKEYASKIMKELKWTGVAMVEFKTDTRDNKPKLMEINPRFWGSVQLSIVSGINFPYLLYQQFTGKAENDPTPNPSPNGEGLKKRERLTELTYRTGIRSRWLIAGDIMHFIANQHRFRLKPSFLDFGIKTLIIHSMIRVTLKGMWQL